jgi:hypothetical protein
VLLHCRLEILEGRDESREDDSGALLLRRKKGKTVEQLAAEADVLAGLKAADAEALGARRATAKATLRNVFTAYFRVLRGGLAAAALMPEVLPMMIVAVVSDPPLRL